MRQSDTSIFLSASDLVGHLNCRHLTDLEVASLAGTAAPPHFHDPLLQILIERGERHETDYLAHLAQDGVPMVRIAGEGIHSTLAERTREAMAAGAPIIAQAVLMHGNWSGRADVLLRIETPSAFGTWSYEAVDTKLARETKAGTVLQLSLYSDLLAQAQNLTPQFMHVITPEGGFRQHRWPTMQYAAYYRYVKRHMEAWLAAQHKIQTYPEPVGHCEICRWRIPCDTRRRTDDHLCLVANVSKVQRGELARHGVTTAAALASLPLPLAWKPDRGARQSYERAREQARVQVVARESGQPVFETLPLLAGRGLSRLPAPSPGDMFLDLEGDPFFGEGGLEFLFGYATADSYAGGWALSRQQEHAQFTGFVEFVMQRWAQYPDMHVYHYSPYEPGALKRLMGRYAACEDEIDRMLRGGLFVDLLSVVRQGVRAGIESYSIKNLEVFYGFERPVKLVDARRALATLQAILELGDAEGPSDELKEVIEGYNRDDCRSALELRDWLEQLRASLIEGGADISRPVAPSPEPGEDLDERQQRIAELVGQLTDGVPVDRVQRSVEQHARWLLAYLLDWHRREQKSIYWEKFRLADLPAEELIDERHGLSGLTFIGTVGGTPQCPVHRYSFPHQDVEIRAKDPLCRDGGESLGDTVAISLDDCTIDIKKTGKTAGVHPSGVLRHKLIGPKPKPAALLRIGEWVSTHGMNGEGPYRIARELLMRVPPAQHATPLRLADEAAVDAAVRFIVTMKGGVLPIQGPPGSGKTYTAARMICALVKAGRRIGVTANSHPVIRNLLDEVVRAADKINLPVQCIQKPDAKQEAVHGIRFTTRNEELIQSLGVSCQVGGATSWLWAREDAFECVDVLFVDEAAQMSLADVVALSQAGCTLVLLGDPQQLNQPMQGTHPEGTGVSALDHILEGKPTIAANAGLFLEETWRMHPAVCAFTSELFYDGRLHARASVDVLRINSTSRIQGSGLRYCGVAHTGNQNSSPEEAQRIHELVHEVLGAPSTWIDREGVEKPLTPDEILIMAPYNAQVIELRERLPGARIGTVDKFQGQEAALVIYSLTTSSAADAPRGMEFLYSLNRLNVATSRAKCLCILVGSPALLEADCRTPRQMQLANALCRYFELAVSID